MKLSRDPFSASKRYRDSAFHVAIVYEDYTAGRSAMDIYQSLLSRFGGEFDFRIGIWSFEALQCAKLNHDAIQATIEADAVVFATHLRDTLPEEVERWIQAWVPRKRGQAAVLIALLGSDPDHADVPSRACNFLKKAAADADMEFLVQQISHAKDNFSPLPAYDRPGGYSAPEGWGLNE